MSDARPASPDPPSRSHRRPITVRRLVRNFAIELVLYGLLVVGYFLVALRWLGAPLVNLFQDRLTAYAVASLGLIVFQGIALEAITAFLVRQLGLERLE